jgi:hypothetical protein
MRFRRGKEEGDGAAAAPPDAATRVRDPEAIASPPPSAAERVEEPAKVLPAAGGVAALDPTPTSGHEVQDAAPAADAGPRSPAPPPDPGARTEFPAPGPAERVEAPPSSPAGRLDAPPPAAAARVGSPAIAAPPPQPAHLVSPAPATGTACPNCGSAAQPGQEMCIVCGARIAPEAATPGGWRLFAVLAALGVLLIGTGAAFAIVELTEDDEVKQSDVANLSENPPPPPPATTQPAPPASTTPTEPAPTIPPAGGQTQPDDPSAQPDTPSTTPDPGGEIAEWPAGRTAYTVVLVSATSRNAADAKAEQAIKRGIKAGVLRSDDFSSLRPGYWVVFAGQYDTSEQATRAADRYAEQGFGGGYPRQVKPK